VSWREQAAPIIRRVLEETEGQDERAIRAALRAAYPWGPRANYPYQVWLDECARQRGVSRARPATSLPLFDDEGDDDDD
jgi:hypothetical protein